MFSLSGGLNITKRATLSHSVCFSPQDVAQHVAGNVEPMEQRLCRRCSFAGAGRCIAKSHCVEKRRGKKEAISVTINIKYFGRATDKASLSSLQSRAARIAHFSRPPVTTCWCEFYYGAWRLFFSSSHLREETDILRSAICTGAKRSLRVLLDDWRSAWVDWLPCLVRAHKDQAGGLPFPLSETEPNN